MPTVHVVSFVKQSLRSHVAEDVYVISGNQWSDFAWPETSPETIWCRRPFKPDYRETIRKLVKLQLTFLSFLSFLHFRLDSWFLRATFVIHLVIPLVINFSKLSMLQFSRIDCGFAPRFASRVSRSFTSYIIRNIT